MKKHHSIFGTKSIPDYRKQEFRNRRNRRQENIRRDDREYEQEYDREYEQEYDREYEQEYDREYDQSYDHESEQEKVRKEDAHENPLNDEGDLENEICKTAEETSGSYQNIDDTVLIKAAVIAENEASSNTEFPIDFMDDEIPDDTRNFDTEYDSEYDSDEVEDYDSDEMEEYGSDEMDEYGSDELEEYVPDDRVSDDYATDDYEEYLEASEDAFAYGNDAADEASFGEQINAYEDGDTMDGGWTSEELEDDLKEEAEKERGQNFNKRNRRKGAAVAANSRSARKRPVQNEASFGKTSQGRSARRRPAKRKKKRQNNIVLFFKNTNTLEKLSLVIGLVVVITGVTLGSLIIRTRARANEISSFSNVGSEIYEMQVPGSAGLVAVADAQAAKKAAAEAVSEAASAATTQEETGIKVNLSMASIKQDLKIKFLNSETARLISGVPFEVEVKKPDGTATTWKDEDKDGIIYHYDIPAGTYTVTMKELTDSAYSDYTFNTTSQKIEVKENIEYKPVDVSDEVKDESQVNVAAEDTVVEETVVESENTDTVEWVESTKTEIGSSGEVSYEEIKKDTVVNPYSAKGVVDADGMQMITSSDSVSEGTTLAEGDTESSSNSSGASTSSTDNKDTDDNSNDSDNGNTSSDNSGSNNNSGNGSGTGETTEQPKTYTYEVTPTSATVKVGDSVTLTAKTDHEGISVSWSSSNESVATVSGGTVTGKAEGTATITANFNNEKAISIQITVEKKTYTYTISKESISLKVAATEKLTTDTTLDDKTVTWSSSDEKIAKVASDGTITAVAAGTATITATFKDGTKKLCTVTVTKGDGKIELSSSKATIIVGGSVLTLTAKVTGLTDTTVTWKSADESIATVADGKVTGKKAGTVKITATCKADESVTATCEVTVKDGAGELKDKSGNIVYVADNGSYRKATVADYDKASKFYIQKEGKLYKYTGWQTIEGYTYFYDKDGNVVTGDQVIQGAKYSFGTDGRLNSGSGTLGIDVSKWNGSIDWAQVKNSGVSYVIIRCGYRGSSTGALIEDPKFRTNIKGATAAGLKVGVYFFTQAVTDVEAVEEASMVISLIKGYNISCPVFLDVEAAHGRADGISVATRTAVCKAFCATIKNAGYTAGIYANKTWLNSYIDTTSLTGYKIWLAQYAATPTYSRTRYDMWQYSSKGSVAGISGRVDMNISYMGF